MFMKNRKRLLFYALLYKSKNYLYYEMLTKNHFHFKNLNCKEGILLDFPGTKLRISSHDRKSSKHRLNRWSSKECLTKLN